MKLNEKREIFARAVAGGKTLIDAYREAGYSQNCKEQTQYEKASRLNAVPEVRAYIEQLKSEQKQMRVEVARQAELLRRQEIEWTKEQSIYELMKIVRLCMLDIQENGIGRGNASTAIQAIDKLNLLEGLYDSSDNETKQLIAQIRERNRLMRES